MKKIKYSLLKEGLEKHDLLDLVDNVFLIDKFKPKFASDKDIIVTAFSCKNESAAEDLSDFIEKGNYEIPLQDCETSFAPDNKGNWLVFIETDRTRQYPKLLAGIIKDIERLTDKLNWKFIPLGKEMPIKYSVENIENYVILSSIKYVNYQEQNNISERFKYLTKY
jgi:hypothetical protein